MVNGAAALAGKRASLSGHLVYADHDSMIGIAIWQPCHDEASESLGGPGDEVSCPVAVMSTLLPRQGLFWKAAS